MKQGSDPHSRAIVWVRGGAFKAKSETVDLWQLKWNENQTVLEAAIHMPDRITGLLQGPVAGSWSLGIVEQSQCKDCCWLWRNGLRGCEGGDCGGKFQSWAAMEARWYCWVTCRGWSHHHSLSPHNSVSSWTVERLGHQLPEALNYRVGPHPGCPFKCLIHQSTE